MSNFGFQLSLFFKDAYDNIWSNVTQCSNKSKGLFLSPGIFYFLTEMPGKTGSYNISN